MSDMSDGVREFLVRKDTGDYFRMRYTSHGVQWIPTSETFSDREENPVSPRPSPWSGGSGPWDLAIQVANVASQIAATWEARQQRLAVEAAHEERKVLWLEDMLRRWSEASQATGGLDLRATEFLAREARTMADALGANKKVGLPQSILYDLVTVTDAVGLLRQTILAQFHSLESTEDANIRRVMEERLGGRRLNLAFVDDLGRDPAVVWMDMVQTKNPQKFHDLMPQLPPTVDGFMTKLYPDTAVTAYRKPSAMEEPGLAATLKSLVARIMPRDEAVTWNVSMSDRFDPFRELFLLPAEVQRTKALHSAWMATAAILSEGTGRSLEVEIGPDGLAMHLVDRHASNGAPRRIVSKSQPEIGS